MDNKNQKLLNELVSNITTKQEFDKVQEALLKQGIESLLNAEMLAHLGYAKGEKPINGNVRNGFSEKTIKSRDGNHRIKIPRDREASFDPVTIPKHKRISQDLEDTILLLYARGMSNADITYFMEKTYGVAYSTSQISIITDSLLEDIRKWQIRPLDDQYAVVWIDGIHYKIRHEGRVVTKACMLVIGINMDGKQDLLSMHITEVESASAWMSMLDDLKSRGVQDILFICSDNLTGLDKAIEAVYPQTIRQICIVHQVRNSLKYVSYNERREMARDIKEIYRSINEDAALKAFELFKEKWGKKYRVAVKSWEVNWDNLTAFLQYPQEIRKLIYTTNVIESFNAGLRKYTKNKKSFPTDDAALKSIYLGALNVQDRWQKSRQGWSQIYNQLYINFESRVKPTNR